MIFPIKTLLKAYIFEFPHSPIPRTTLPLSLRLESQLADEKQALGTLSIEKRRYVQRDYLYVYM
jgi:hypothetical protein